MGAMRRRDFLRAALGASAGAAACRLAPIQAPLPEGEVVGAAASLGHRVREARVERPGPDRWEHVEVAIVGAGIAGLAAARRLRRAGVEDFVLLDVEPAVGGTSRSGRTGGLAHPWGAHYLPAPAASNPDLVELLDEMGVVEGRDAEGEPVFAEEVLVRDPEERVFYRGRWYEGLYLTAGAGPADLEELRRFQSILDDWSGRVDGRGRRAFAVPSDAGSDDADLAALDAITMASWMDERGFGSPRLRWLVDYACRDDYGLRAEGTSAWAGLYYFAARIPKPGRESEPLLTWPEGNGRIVSHLARFARGAIRTGEVAIDVEPVAEGVEIVAAAASGEVRGLRARHAIFAAPQFVARHVVGPWRREPPDHLAAFTYAPWLVANLHLRDRPVDRGFPAAWDNVLYESDALGYVVATHQAGIDRGETVWTWYEALAGREPRDARDRLEKATQPQLAERVLSDLERAHPDLRSRVGRLDVMKWGHAMVRAVPGFRFGRDRVAASRPLGRLHFANADLAGLPLIEEAFFHGNRAADAILASRRAPDLSRGARS